MTKKLRLNKNVADKQRCSSNLHDLIETVKNLEEEGRLVRINFEVSEPLRNAFKAKVASQGKKVKDVFAEFMREYIKE